MKSLRHLLICVGAAGLALAGCERHEFENTKRLHMEHGEHHEGEHHGEEHHDGDHHEADHKKEGHDDHHKDDHKKGDHAHGEKKAETPAKPKEEAKKEAPRNTGL